MIRVCLFDDTGGKSQLLSGGQAFSAPFSSEPTARVVGSCDTLSAIQEFVARGDVDVIAVNLDGAAGMEAVQQLNAANPDFGIVGVSKKTDSAFIISAMRMGCSQFVCWPIDPEDLRNALHRARPQRLAGSVRSKRICVVGSSGGAGATTVACNLAIELANLTGRQTGLVDMNLEYGDVCCAFDVTPKYTIADICADSVELDFNSLTAAMHNLPCNVSLLGRPEHVEQARDISPQAVDQLFRMVADLYPHVVVDLPRSFSFLSAAAIGPADFVLIVTQLGVPFIRNATRVFQMLRQMDANEDCIHIVLNRCKAEFERLTPKDVEQHFRRPVFAVIPNDYRPVRTSLDLGHPIGADAPGSRARAAIQDMARRLTADMVAPTEIDKPRKSSFLSKLLGRRTSLT